jgi:hypothetical protein
MADETDNLDPLIADLAKYGIGGAGAIGANAITQQAYQAAIKNLQDRFGDYQKVGTPSYKDIAPERLGASALTKIAPDVGSRVDQQAAEAALQNITNSGGLNLSDRAALNDQESILSRNNAAREKSLANQYAARGQLGSGAQLSMDLANQQNAAENANKHGESIAAQAQQRAMQAILSKAGIARNMSQDDYARARAAAEATDSINRYNASMGTEAQGANNRLREQGYNDQLRKLQGETGLTDSLNNALLGSGKANANTIAGASYGGAGLTGDVLTAAAKVAKKAGGSGGGGDNSNNNGSDNQTTEQTQNDPANLTGGHADTEDPTTAGGTGVPPEELDQWNSLSGG